MTIGCNERYARERIREETARGARAKLRVVLRELADELCDHLDEMITDDEDRLLLPASLEVRLDLRLFDGEARWPVEHKGKPVCLAAQPRIELMPEDTRVPGRDAELILLMGAQEMDAQERRGRKQ